jgi:hypothetical protein
MITKDVSIIQPKGALKPGYAWRFWYKKEYLHYSTCKAAVNESIRLYKGYNVPVVSKIQVLKGRDKFGVFFIPKTDTNAHLFEAS